jgi:hypothetical protein
VRFGRKKNRPGYERREKKFQSFSVVEGGLRYGKYNIKQVFRVLVYVLLKSIGE